MNSLSHRVLGATFALALSVCAGLAAAAPTKEADWVPLTDDTSRATLFERYIESLPPAERKFAIPTTFVFPFYTSHNSDGSQRTSPAIFGIDISHYQGAGFPFAELARQNVGFVYIKATQGVRGADPQFGRNWPAAIAATNHVPRGAFHFLASDPKQSGEAQADSFLAYVKLHGNFRPGDLPPALDLEWDVACKTCPDRWRTNHRAADSIVAETVAFLDRVHTATGRMPLLYTNRSFLNSVGVRSPAMIATLQRHAKIWVFDVTSSTDKTLERPDPKKNLPSSLWQFTSAAKLGRIYPTGVDADVFLGTQASFADIFLKPNT